MTNTIVVGYDGGEAARRALDRAVAEAQGSDGRLVVLAVAEMPLNPEGPQTFGAIDSPPEMIPLLEPPEIDSILGEARERVEAAGLTADYAWAAGEPAAAIVGEARDRGADLIVVGSHHHSALGRLLGTDVAAEIKREAGCEVIAVD
jgi:nucleotide-binding universal stress UspA family protein